MIDISKELLTKYHNQEIYEDYKVGDRVRLITIPNFTYLAVNTVQVGDEGTIHQLDIKEKVYDCCTEHDRAICDTVHRTYCIGVTLDKIDIQSSKPIIVWSCSCRIEKI